MEIVSPLNFIPFIHPTAMMKNKNILENIKIISDVKLILDDLVETYEFWYTSDGLRVKGFISIPKIFEGILPVVIVNRGGSGDFGKITTEYLKFFNFLSLNGYITIHTQYRGNDGGEGRDRMGGDDIFDVINLYEILKEISFVDLNRIGMTGASRGGMMTFQALIRVSWIKAAVAVAPLVDEFDMSLWREGWVDHQKEMYGGYDVEKYKRSALCWPEKFPKVPLLIFHGSLDTKSNSHKSIELVDKLKKLGVPVELVLYPDGDHFISKRTVDKTIEWFALHL